jgi:predicted nucleotidyltransferase
MLLFKSKITQKVLNYYFVNLNVKHYINELARILELDPKNLFRKLQDLEREGILSSETVGKQKYYFLNKSFHLLKEYQSIFNKTFGLEGLLQKIVVSNSDVSEAYIFGSYAKNKMDAFSDIDVLLIGNFSSIEMTKRISQIEKSIGKEINLLSLSFDEYSKRKNKKGDLINNILKDKIIKIK